MNDYNVKLLQEPDDLLFRSLGDRKVRWGYFKDGWFSFLGMMTTTSQAERAVSRDPHHSLIRCSQGKLVIAPNGAKLLITSEKN